MLEHAALQESLAPLELTVHQELMEKTEMMAYRDQLADRVQLDLQGSLERGVHKALLDFPATQAPLVQREHLVHLVHVV